MVSGVNGSTIYKDWKAASNISENPNVQYMGKETAQAAEKSDTFVGSAKSAAGSAFIFEGIPLLKYLKNNKKLGGKMTEEMVKLSESTQAAFKNIFNKKAGGKLTERIGQYIEVANKNKAIYHDIKGIAKAGSKAPKLAKAAEEAAAKAATNPNVFTKKAAEKAAAKAEAAAAKAAEKVTAATIEKGAAEATGKAVGKLGKVGKFMKSSGAGVMLAFSGIIEGATEVIPTFKELGAKKGMKQLGKSAIKVVGDTAGFIAGEQLGTAAGSAIGTAICPGIGTAIGAAVGFVGGMLGSFIAGKVTKAIVGKSERELAKEEQEKNQPQEYEKTGTLLQVAA